MDDLNSISNERISVLADGCLQGAQCVQTVQALLLDADALRTWHTYHVVGDVLRSAELAPRGDDLAFWSRLHSRLESETVQFGETVAPVGVNAPVHPSAIAGAHSANASVFGWKLLAGVACSALVGVVALSGLSLNTPQGAVGMAALTPANSLASTASVAQEPADSAGMVRDPQLDALMVAHRQFDGHSALQSSAGFLRNAVFERPAP